MKKPAGRKPKSADVRPLDPVDAVAAIRTLALIRDREGWTYERTAQLLADEAEQEPISPEARELASEADFMPDDNTVYRALRSGRPPNDPAAKAIILWMSRAYADEFVTMRLEEHLRQRETLVSALKDALGHGAGLTLDAVRSFAGEYRLYQPFHLKPRTHIMVSRFSIGRDENLFDCMMTSRFTNELGKEREGIVGGKIVPHGTRLLAIMTSAGTSRSNFIIHFDGVDHHLNQEAVDSLGGLMIAAAGTESASAWPVFAERLNEAEEFEPHVIEASNYAELPLPLRDRFDRGAVYWHAKDYPKPFGE